MSQGDFDNGASEYAKLAHTVTRNIASAALNEIPPLNSQSRVLDLACGSGEVTSLIVEDAISRRHDPPPTVLGLDIAAGMVKLYQAKADSNSWSTVFSRVQDAQDLSGITDSQFDLVFMNFGLMYVTDGVRCTKEVYQVLKPGGCAVFTTWNHAGVPKLVADATTAVGAPRFFSPTDNGWDAKEKLVSTVQAGGFEIGDIQVTVEKTAWEKGSGDGVVEALSSSFWNPLHDGTPEATSKWQNALRQQLTPQQKETGAIDMIAWACVAKKDQ
ncbi:uncharacterized protein NECHADRAFT_87589 [Fusarium vanettenii 77-13-4]|uniref:Methyltransferase type 11 domain-containing protein n=1 Tax=Fusarium vanettenii (strain ATCC MYA-4622 / CBS 123669 / FGSC 9596 / NRRL 45880 / 77-13-4) TaxID=660122 RepID=C7Z2G0_FUSV7|nr:uncharacterized protein NECHADRAFT_87589 [Fusarium vanettenii 77-13-4]EEU41473.1 hypothetical protein NECHADRAFT_87589 [Fusarium vanettenii 77-13-4]